MVESSIFCKTPHLRCQYFTLVVSTNGFIWCYSHLFYRFLLFINWLVWCIAIYFVVCHYRKMTYFVVCHYRANEEIYKTTTLFIHAPVAVWQWRLLTLSRLNRVNLDFRSGITDTAKYHILHSIRLQKAVENRKRTNTNSIIIQIRFSSSHIVANIYLIVSAV